MCISWAALMHNVHCTCLHVQARPACTAPVHVHCYYIFILPYNHIVICSYYRVHMLYLVAKRFLPLADVG